MDIFAFIKDAWGLIPQIVKPEHEDLLLKCRAKGDYKEMTLDMFTPYISGRNLTWQQVEFFHSVNDAIQGRGLRKITVRSGHGVGKTAGLSIVLIYVLTCFKDAQVPCTANSQTQLRDVLWKDVSKRLRKLPQVLIDQFDYSAEYVRCKSAPNERFARARTASKENPEALAGVHGPFVCLLVDEASGVCEEVYEVAKGALTNENTLLIMISNPTRLEGYFYDSHTKYSKTFRTLHFDSLESPIVSAQFVNDMIQEHGQDSEEYDIRVRGNFPNVEGLDDGGYVPLVNHTWIKQTMDYDLSPGGALGVDPSGEGDDQTLWVYRDQFKSRILAREKISNGLGICHKTIQFMKDFEIPQENVSVDNFGVGVDAIKHLALAGYNVSDIYLGAISSDKSTYLNKRAELFWKARAWLAAGGELVRDSGRDELKSIKYKRVEGRNVIQIEPKERLKKRGVKSPNVADAFMLTFAVDLSKEQSQPLLCDRSSPHDLTTKSISDRYADFLSRRK